MFTVFGTHAGRLVVSSSDDKTVKLWDGRTRACVRTFYDHTDCVNLADFNPDATCIASASADHTVKLWDMRTQQLLQHYDAHDAAVSALSFHPSGSYLLTSSADATLKLWDLVEGRLYCTLHGHEGAVNACSFSPDGAHRFAARVKISSDLLNAGILSQPACMLCGVQVISSLPAGQTCRRWSGART